LLPIGTKTEIVVTYNLRIWRWVFEQRALNDHAQWEIRRLMGNALWILGTLIPCVFEDQLERLPSSKSDENPNS
jgi:thymidylate synthase ThyX